MNVVRLKTLESKRCFLGIALHYLPFGRPSCSWEKGTAGRKTDLSLFLKDPLARLRGRYQLRKSGASVPRRGRDAEGSAQAPLSPSPDRPGTPSHRARFREAEPSAAPSETQGRGTEGSFGADPGLTEMPRGAPSQQPARVRFDPEAAP